MSHLSPITCGTYRVPTLRAELQAAYEALDATNHPIAYAVCRTHDGAAWEVNIRRGNIDSALDGSYADHEAATAADEAWLRQQSGPPWVIS
jgi:hypothetical protein